MRKLTLGVLAFYLQLLAAYSQPQPTVTPTDSSGYSLRKLKLKEVNLVSSYYQQDGNNSAVTGGIGTEKLTDIGSSIELKLNRFDRRQREHAINLDLDIAHYTSASSDKIDPATLSSASYADTRYAPSVGYALKNEAAGITIGATASYAAESDYWSKGLGLYVTKTSKDNNRELSLKLQTYLDQWWVILPIELRTPGPDRKELAPRNSFSASLSFSQVVSPRFQFTLLADGALQKGLLGTSYHRVYFKNDVVDHEQLPNRRLKLPLGIRAHYFISDQFIARSAYRFYTDNWGVTAHTAELELPYKLSPFVSIAPFYRYYTQTGTRYFAGYKEQEPSATYFTSDYDLATFQSQYYGANFRFTPLNGILGMKHWSQFEIRYGHYSRSNDLYSNTLSLHMQFK